MLFILLYCYHMLLFWIMIYIKIHATFMIRAGFCGSAMVFEALVSRGSTSSVHTSQTEFLQHNLTTSETQGTWVHDPILMITNLCHNHMETFHFTLVLSWQGENFRTRASQSHCRQQRADSKLFFLEGVGIKFFLRWWMIALEKMMFLHSWWNYDRLITEST